MLLYDAVQRWFEEAQARFERGPTVGMRTGIEAFDHAVGGLHVGEVVLLIGEPGVGKSILARQLAAEFALGRDQDRAVRGVLLVSSHTSAERVAESITCALGRVHPLRLRSADLDEAATERLFVAADTASQLPIWVVDAAPETAKHLTELLDDRCDGMPVKLLVVDDVDERVTEIRDALAVVRAVAIARNAAAIVVSRAARASCERFGADTVIEITRDHRVTVIDARNAIPGPIAVRWTKETLQFEDLGSIRWPDEGDETVFDDEDS